MDETDFQQLSNRDRARLYARLAYAELKKAGTPEDYLWLMQHVGTQEWGTFFGQFGDDKGMYLRIESDGPMSPVQIAVGIRRYKCSWWSRIKESLATLWSRDVEYAISLTPENTTKLKDLIRSME